MASARRRLAVLLLQSALLMTAVQMAVWVLAPSRRARIMSLMDALWPECLPSTSSFQALRSKCLSVS